uniref:Uncharacterized protein n=1 Tax=Amphimedon queenslandica TaxID=400682 RepID=A0A1X7UY06_AMPQE
MRLSAMGHVSIGQFQTISGTEDNHFAVCMSLINLMLDHVHVLAFGRLIPR